MNLRELSQQLGLSQTTVSRALNGYPEVSEATRARVQEFAARHSYRPSPQAKGLATGKSLAIGHVLPSSASHEMLNPVFGDFIAGAGEIYARHGYQMMISVLDPAADEAAVYRDLKSRRAVDGVVVHGPLLEDGRIALLQDIDLPFVVHGRTTHATRPYSWVDVNNRRAFRRATEFLFDLGHRRFGLINGLADMDFANRRRIGFEDALAAHGITPDPALIQSGEMTETYGHRACRAMLHADTPPTAILVSSMISALGVRRAIEEMGLVMGRDVSVITYDDNLSYLSNAGDAPVYTTTRSSVRQAGRQLAQMLLQIIATPDAGPLTTLLEADLVVGHSTGPAPTSNQGEPT